MDDTSAILDDLLKRFGGRLMLGAKDVAEAIGRSVEATNTLIRRGGLTLPVEKVGGENCVSIYALADWLAGKCPKIAPKRPVGDFSAPPLPPPSRKRPDLTKALLGFASQRDFLGEVYSELEAIMLESLGED